MKRSDCVNEKVSSRTVGLIILPFALLIGLVGAVLVPIFGFLFSAPFLVLAIVFLKAPESKVCKLLLSRSN